MAAAAPDFDNAFRQYVADIKRDVERHTAAISGEPSTGTTGLLDRVKVVETFVERMEATEAANAAWRKGVAIGIGLQLITTGGLLGLVLKVVAELLAKHP